MNRDSNQYNRTSRTAKIDEGCNRFGGPTGFANNVCAPSVSVLKDHLRQERHGRRRASCRPVQSTGTLHRYLLVCGLLAISHLLPRGICRSQYWGSDESSLDDIGGLA